jgi:hypothetical protein
MARSTFRRPSPSAGIDDWLNLVDPDGAFLTASQLRGVFPHGFDPLPNDQRSELRAQLADLDADPAGPLSLRLWLLSTVLQWSDGLAEHQQLPVTSLVRAAEHGVQLRPTLALLDVDDANLIRVAVFVWPMGTRLDRRPDIAVAGDTWPASPVQRAEAWCREAGVPLALVTDDDQWVLVWAPRGAPAASCRWRIGDLADERVLQAGFVSLLGARRFFAVEESETLEALFRHAADAEVEITKGLGLSVRRSVELLVAALSRDDVATGGRALSGIAATEVYEASVSVLMRLVFLLFAEERRLLPAEDPLWAESYSVLTLREDLRSAALRDGEDALERRSTAWHRLLATFRAVHGGVNHDRLTLPAYGGSLFDPGRFPFLEGRRVPDHIIVGGQDLGPAEDVAEALGRPIAIDDRTVLAILDALLTVEVKAGRTTVAQRLSYKALDVEQIGHCYEGLLDHGAAPIDVLSLGLVGPDGGEPEISITDLETRLGAGAEALCEWLSEKDKCDKTPSTLAGLLAKKPEGVELARLRVACGHDDGTTARVSPFWGLIRTDLRGLPVVLLPGSQYVTQMSTRRNMGAQYTTKALAEEVVRYALEPLVYDPGPQNEPDAEKWKLRAPHEILNLRVCDPAVGSGAILTAAGRYLADRLIESVTQYGPGEGPFAERLAELVTASADDQVVLARREIVDHCLYGVDKNPVAAEMAKLSLWLTTMARERPFTFLDHAIQVGDSLLGITNLEQLRWLHLDPDKRKGTTPLVLDKRIKEATEIARCLQALSVITVRDATEKQRLHEELRAKLADLAVVADTVVGAALSTAGKPGVTMEDRLTTQIYRVRTALGDTSSELERSAALAALQGASSSWLRTGLPDEVPVPWERQCLHWPLAFPEVFLGSGRRRFDVIVGNPPFLGGTKISEALGQAYRQHLSQSVAGRPTNRADLVAFFLLRAADVGRRFGLLATNTVSQGDTREVGLSVLIDERNWVVTSASKSSPWPGDATLEIAKLWLQEDAWDASVTLDGQCVARIDSLLQSAGRSVGPPKRLDANLGKSFLGDQLNSLGFVMSVREADDLIRIEPSARDIVRPYLSGEDLNTSPTQEASRLVITFHDWPLKRAERYPAALDLVRRRAKPDIDRKGKNYKGWSDRWWQFWMYKSALHRTTDELSRVVAIAKVSKTVAPVLAQSNAVFTDMVVIFAYDDDGHFGLLTSALHWWWAVTYASTMRTDLRYTPSDVFETFPQPMHESGSSWERVAECGRVINEFRSDLMVRTELGLTKTYNRVHNSTEIDPEIVRLRELHVELDYAVRDGYGWTDVELNHHHWETQQGVRFTVSPAAKDELLDRLLELNHQRYAEEVAAGLHDKKAKKTPTKRSKVIDVNQESLL